MNYVKAAWLVVIFFGTINLIGLGIQYQEHQAFLQTEAGACFEKCVDNGLPPRFPVQSSPCVCSVEDGLVPWVNLSGLNVSSGAE